MTMPASSPFPWDHPRFRSWISVGRACQMMQQALTRLLEPLGIKPPQLDILVNLYRREGISQQELARKLLVGRSNMSMLLPQMETKGLIERRADKQDKRVLRLHLTEQGRALTEKAMVIQTGLIERMMGPSPIETCLTVAETMEALIGRLIEDEKAATETLEDPVS